MIENLLNYSLEELKSLIHDKPFEYLVVDDFFKEDVYKQLDNFKLSEKDMRKGHNASSQGGRVGGGKNYYIGGRGGGYKSFKPFIKTDQQKNILKQLNDSTAFWCNLFDIKEKKDYKIGYKYSLYTNNYGWNIHPDHPQKVISVLFYLNNDGWEEYSKYNGTQIYCVGEELEEEADIDVKDHWRQLKRVDELNLHPSHEDQIRFHKNVHYKPNRMLAFLNGRKSYHGIYPMNLPENKTRGCFQVNIWRESKSRYVH
tara:strand:- start:42 stop:809 length:768 start_codon:yes stop_codon:yes gene_type:complete